MFPAFGDQPPPSSNTTIHNLPDLVLVEILCRLPHSKVVFRCKLVSKHWRTVLSDLYFVNRFLRIQHDQQKPLLHQHVMVPSEYANRKTLVLTMSSSSEPPLLEASVSSIFSVFPCLRSHNYADRAHKLYVEGTYNDLVLCTQGNRPRRVYYICNCYTKEWIRLPPSPLRRPDDQLRTGGFICEPYYNIKEEGTSSNSSNIKLHDDYRYRVVRLINRADSSFLVEVFSSETGEWREYSLSRILDQKQHFLLSYVRLWSPGIACNGKLHWLSCNGSIFQLDPLGMCGTSDGEIIDKCRFIDSPTLPNPDLCICSWHIGVCRGSLQMCPDSFDFFGPMAIWELKGNEVDDKPEWLLRQITFLSEMVIPKQVSMVSKFRVVGFHPIHRDIVYLQYVSNTKSEPRYIVMCNVREKTLEIATEIPSENSPEVSWLRIVPYVIPWWPTPVPTGLKFREEYHNITVTVIGTGIDTFTLKVGSFTTVKQFKQELEEKKGHQQLDRELHSDGKLLDDDDKWLADYGIKDNASITLERLEFWPKLSLFSGFSNNC